MIILEIKTKFKTPIKRWRGVSTDIHYAHTCYFKFHLILQIPLLNGDELAVLRF